MVSQQLTAPGAALPIEDSEFTAGTCRLCGHTPLTPVHQEQVITFRPDREGVAETMVQYMGCPECALIQVDPLPSLDFLRNYYRSAPAASLDHDVLHNVKDRYFLGTIAFLQRFLKPPPKRLFETGAASAYLLHLLAEAFQAEVAGIEPSEQCRVWAQREFGIELLPGFLEDLDLEAHHLREAFDLNLCCSVIEHVPWPERLMARMADTVKPEGHLYLEVPSLGPPQSGNLVEKVVQPLHLSYFSPTTLFRLGAETGLTILHVEEVRDLEVPVYRAMYRKVKPLDHAQELLSSHAREFGRRQQAILETCGRYVAGADNVWIWGIGNNFFDLWTHNAAIFAPEKCRLVDKSPAKIGKRLGPLVVSPPDPAICGDPEVILVATSSRLIQENIMKEAKRLFPEIPIHSLFESETTYAAQ